MWFCLLKFVQFGNIWIWIYLDIFGNSLEMSGALSQSLFQRAPHRARLRLSLVDFSRWSMVGEWARSGAPLASGGMQAVRFQVDATAERPAGLGPWLPYSESKPAARARVVTH